LKKGWPPARPKNFFEFYAGIFNAFEKVEKVFCGAFFKKATASLPS
jgi:hypothetical protein